MKYPFGSCAWYVEQAQAKRLPVLPPVVEAEEPEQEELEVQEEEFEVNDRDLPLYIIVDQQEALQFLDDWAKGNLQSYFA